MISLASKIFQTLKRIRQLTIRIHLDISYHRKFKGPDFPPLLWRILEQSLLLVSNAIHARDYYRLDLYHRDRSWEIKQSYFGSWGAAEFFEMFNKREYWGLLDDKTIFARYFSEGGLPVPQSRCALGHRANIDGIDCLRSKEEISGWFNQPGIQDLFIKPADSIRGQGVISLGERIDSIPSWRSLPTDDAIALDGILAHVDEWSQRGSYLIVQDRIEPHPDLAAILPHVLHTVRVVTLLVDGEGKVLDTVLKMGRRTYPADNPLLRGGLIVPVDLETGISGQPITVVNGLAQRIDHHPDSGKRVTGLKIPDWPEVVSLARRAAERCWFHQTIGWDIALTPNGPIIIEGNWNYATFLNQIGRDSGILMTVWPQVLLRPEHFSKIGLGVLQGWRHRIHTNPQNG